jgi:hypothetical protein
MFTSDSSWINDLRADVQRRQDTMEQMRQAQEQVIRSADEAVARADALVRTLLDQMNQALLGGRGSVWGAPARWGVHLWELWWEPRRERGPYVVVTLLRDSRGTPYLKVQGRRLPLHDATLERRLQRALRAAFLQPRIYTPRVRVPSQEQDMLRPAPMGVGREGGGLSELPPAFPSTHLGEGGPAEDTWEDTMRARRRRPRQGRGEA